jgi:hypothetical protein
MRNDVVGNVYSKPTVGGTERSWINGSTALGSESNTQRYRRRYPLVQVGFFDRYYWRTRLSSGRSCSVMMGGALPLDLVAGQ